MPKDSFLKKAVGYFSAASKVIPVGQPTFGLAGAGVDAIYAMGESKNPIQEIIDRGPSLVRDFEQMDFKQANSELRAKLDTLSLDKLTKLEKPLPNETGEQRIARIKREVDRKKKFVEEMVGFYGPVVKAIKDQNETYTGRQVSRTALEKEIEKLRKEHKILQSVIKSLKKLMKKQEKVRAELASLNLAVTEGLERINKNYVMISDLSSELLSTNNSLSHKLKVALLDYNEDAKNNLYYYHYKLIKSFEYSTLSSFERKFDLFEIYRDIMNLVDRGEKELTENDLNQVLLVYNNEISEFISSFLRHLDREPNEHSGFSKVISLNMQEITALKRGEKIYLDLTDKNVFGENKENIRVDNLWVTADVEGQKGNIEVHVKHGKESILSRDGIDYLFTHSNEDKAEYLWLASVDVKTGITKHAEVNADNLDVLNRITGTPVSFSKINTKPSARGIYSIELENIKGVDFDLKHLEIEIEYKFELKD